ncbi:carbonyl reductase (NADPH-dependent) ari1 [Cytospora paraplurivora]|uniref:Terpene synthase n=1 Tax=Cytospora paraplurivora TaxID=2898453 RepID=A0AAN9YPX3_9PEZI
MGSTTPKRELNGSFLEPSAFKPLCHPLVESVTKEVDGYFLEHWNFETERSRKKFIGAGFSRVTCLYFPKALDDRIHFACRLLTVLFLIDDALDHMSLAEGSAYNEKLIPIARGHVLPDRSVPVEYITYDLWESMRAHDKELADEILEPTFVFMRAQTDKARLKPMNMGDYFDYREKDVGKALLSALMRFSMGLHVPPSELDLARPVEMNCSKHISIVNDICSYEKEVRTAEESDQEGGVLCSSVPIMAELADVETEAAKRVLWRMCREWEARHLELAQQIQSQVASLTLGAYIEGLEYQMSGNELWSHTTERYNLVDA